MADQRWKFRPHRATLEEAMKEMVSGSGLEELRAYLKHTFPAAKNVRIETYGDGKDGRVGWNDVYLVTSDDGPLGFCDIPVV